MEMGMSSLSSYLVGWALGFGTAVIPYYVHNKLKADSEKPGKTSSPSDRNPPADPVVEYKPAPVQGSLTADRNDPDVNVPEGPGLQNKKYLVLSEEERAKGFIRPVRQSYVHKRCGVVTRMGLALAETYATCPTYYSATWCEGCKDHLLVAEFVWDGTDEPVGS